MWIMLSCQDQPVVTGLSQDGHIHSFRAENPAHPIKTITIMVTILASITCTIPDLEFVLLVFYNQTFSP